MPGKHTASADVDGVWLTNYTKRKKIYPKTIANKLNLSVNTIYKMRQGGSCEWENIQKVADYLGVAIDNLIKDKQLLHEHYTQIGFVSTPPLRENQNGASLQLDVIRWPFDEVESPKTPQSLKQAVSEMNQVLLKAISGVSICFLIDPRNHEAKKVLAKDLEKLLELINATGKFIIQELQRGSIVVIATMAEVDAISMIRAFSQGLLDDINLFRIDFTQLTPKLEAALAEVERAPGDTSIVRQQQAGKPLATLSRRVSVTPPQAGAQPTRSTSRFRWPESKRPSIRRQLPHLVEDARPDGRIPVGNRFLNLAVTLAITASFLAILLPATIAAREAARRKQCENNLKQLAMAVQNYHSSFNVIPPMCTFSYDRETGTVSGQAPISRGWSSTWALALLPQLEQTPLYSAYNFSAPAVAVPGGGFSGLENSTVLGTQLVTFLCPSEDAIIRPALEATSNYGGNYGGPGQVAYYTGTIVPLADPNGFDAPLGKLGPVTIEGIRDGSSNTALFGEHLHGISDGSPNGPKVTLGDKDGKRGIFNVTASGTGSKTGVAGATAFNAARQALPQGTASSYSNRLGNNMYAAHPWQVGMVNYNHVGPPNSVNCLNSSDPAWLTYVGPLGSASASSNHPGGANVAMADGSVRFVKDSISPQVWWAIGSRNGREIIPPSEF